MTVDYLVLEHTIKEAFPNAVFTLKDLVGDSDHYMLDIKDSAFIGKTLVEQHKMVKVALKKHLNADLHALTIKTSV